MFSIYPRRSELQCQSLPFFGKEKVMALSMANIPINLNDFAYSLTDSLKVYYQG